MPMTGAKITRTAFASRIEPRMTPFAALLISTCAAAVVLVVAAVFIARVDD